MNKVYTHYLIVFPENNPRHPRWISGEVMSQLMARALNTWDNAPVEVKELHDIVVHGKVLQDYAGMGEAKTEQHQSQQPTEK